MESFWILFEVGVIRAESFRSWRNQLGLFPKLAESMRNPFEVGGIDSESFRSWRNRYGILSKIVESCYILLEIPVVARDSSGSRVRIVRAIMRELSKGVRKLYLFSRLRPPSFEIAFILRSPAHRRCLSRRFGGVVVLLLSKCVRKLPFS